MNKIVLTFGLIAGAIITTMMVVGTSMIYSNPDAFKANDMVGYATMIVAFAFIFVGVKSFRDKYNGGVISFGKAFRIGLYIVLIAATMYVGVWLIEYYFFYPDFMEKYTECVMDRARNSGATELKLKEQADQMASFAKLYENPLFVILISYAEVIPVGLIVAVISAFILKRKTVKTVNK